ncbi:hypothetical protein GGR34_000843 [Microvirga flocculans]|uniref:Uncharacterized protein n=1 Tax=Microvirga flocculans TaxID=217168 RepID=A0A7W6N6P0_9HYPH|nr:hypothetical protein [Microvirga flocculans]MBB4039208.1 hypothetical protein [Microvirga flocculans]
MSMIEADLSRVGSGEMARTDPAALRRRYQSLLTALANLDFEYERERERMSAFLSGPNGQHRALVRFREKHRERRMPYLHQLAMLRSRLQG